VPTAGGECGREPSSPQTSVQGIEAMSRIVGGISHEMPVTSHHWASNAQRFWLEGIAELTHIKCQNAIYALLSPPFLPLTAFPDSPRLSTTSPLLPTENPTCSLPVPADPPSPPYTSPRTLPYTYTACNKHSSTAFPPNPCPIIRRPGSATPCLVDRWWARK